jgi:molybdopterin-biosynthesis enzyme MoeA-like protein
MLSLPLIPPQDDNSTWLRTSYRPRADSPPPANPQSAAQQPQQHRQNRQIRDEEKRAQQARSPLALLAADEAAIAQRKAAIRNFGAYWIRPPGVPKTLQAMTEEEQERREQEEIERRERGMLDMQAQQQLAEAQQQGAQAMADQEDLEAPEERDLDDDISQETSLEILLAT